ncbi:hypothetical protein HD554DRAFT_2293146 [Boletus coccyginus]|nr:hypothetical protein HD554DRAFT_2293146 [Boletus coccyginus]
MAHCPSLTTIWSTLIQGGINTARWRTGESRPILSLLCNCGRMSPWLIFLTMYVYRAETLVFATVEIRTRQDPSRLSTLSSAFAEDRVAEPSSPNMDEEIEDDFVEPPLPSMMDYEHSSDDSEENEDDSFPHLEPELPPAACMDATPMDREMRALRLVAHLRRPFGALLFTLTSTRRRAVAYRRLGVAVDSIITV